MTRRRQLARGRRTRPATLAALVLLALGVLGAIAAVQIRADRDRTVLGRVSWVTHRLSTHAWDDRAVLVTGIVGAALGLLLLAAGLVPPRRILLRLDDLDPATIAGVSRRGLVRDLTAVAASVDGVDRARVHLRGRHVRVSARTPMRDRHGLAEEVTAAVVRRLAVLAPARPLGVTSRVSGGER